MSPRISVTSLLVLLPLAAGCAQGGGDRSATLTAARDTAPAAGAASSDGAVTLDAVGIAAQFERDWEDFQRLRSADDRPDVDGAKLGPTETRTSGNRPGGPPPIAWNDGTVGPSVIRTPPQQDDPVPVDAPGEPDGDWVTSPFGSPADAAPDDPAPAARSEVSTTPPDVRLREMMVSLSSALYQRAAYEDTPLPEYLAIAALAMVDPARRLNPDAIPDLSDRERELLAGYQQFFAEIGQELRATGDSETLVAVVERLRDAVVDEPDLRIARADLCWKVLGFGRFERFDRNSFLAGTEQQVIVYTEIDDFTSVANEAGEWVTDLSQELVIYNQHDLIPVWRQPWMSAPDLSKNKRSDFFISHIITLPSALTVGSYTLKVRVKDEHTGALAETGIGFAIVADKSLAANVP